MNCGARILIAPVAFSYVFWIMELHFSPEQEAQLARIANDAGATAEELVRDAVLRLLEEDTRFQAALQKVDAALRRLVKNAQKRLSPH